MTTIFTCKASDDVDGVSTICADAQAVRQWALDKLATADAAKRSCGLVVQASSFLGPHTRTVYDKRQISITAIADRIALKVTPDCFFGIQTVDKGIPAGARV